MNHNKKYVIPFKGLNEGNHRFSFKVTKEFFERFEAEDIRDASLEVKVDLNKKLHYLELKFRLTGKVELMCDRCLDYYSQGVENTGKLFVRFGEDEAEINDELVVIPFNENELEISQYIYDFAMLALPVKRHHPQGSNMKKGCDPEMIRLIESLKVRGNNKKIDPRWNKLKNTNL